MWCTFTYNSVPYSTKTCREQAWYHNHVLPCCFTAPMSCAFRITKKGVAKSTRAIWNRKLNEAKLCKKKLACQYRSCGRKQRDKSVCLDKEMLLQQGGGGASWVSGTHATTPSKPLPSPIKPHQAQTATKSSQPPTAMGSLLTPLITKTQSFPESRQFALLPLSNSLQSPWATLPSGALHCWRCCPPSARHQPNPKQPGAADYVPTSG